MQQVIDSNPQEPMGINNGSQTDVNKPPREEWNIQTAQVSLFAPGINKPSGQKPYKQGTLDDVYQWMNSMNMYNLTKDLRAITDEKQQKAFKAENLPYVTFSGTFNYRNAQGLIKHSGLQCFDFDHLGGKDEVWRVREILQNDPCFSTELMFTSPRGNGVKWITHIDLTRGDHAKWYRAISNYLHQTYGLEADPLPSNVASACFLCYDGNIVVNPIVCPY